MTGSVILTHDIPHPEQSSAVLASQRRQELTAGVGGMLVQEGRDANACGGPAIRALSDAPIGRAAPGGRAIRTRFNTVPTRHDLGRRAQRVLASHATGL